MEPQHPVLPPFYLLGGFVFMLLLHFYLPGLRLVPLPWNLLGGVLMLAGGVLTIAGAHMFHKVDTPVRPFEESTVLVTRGVFRFSRNPMYLGMAIALAGTALLLGTLTPWIVPPVFVVVIRYFFIDVEEKLMEQTFGDQYRRYRERVRRWI